MAQYTTVLAEEYNSLKRTMAKILGPATSQSRYGYNTSLLTSSDVSRGQTIKKDEWLTLQADINTARVYQTYTVPTLSVPVKGDNIAWANVVSYQNAVSAAETDAYNQVVYIDTSGKFYSYPNLGSTDTGSQTFAAGWGGSSGNTVKTYSARISWGSREELIAFFNLGGRIWESFYVTGAGTTTKDSAFNYIVTALSGITIDWGRWWSYMGGSAGGLGTTYSLSATTYNNATYSPYNTALRYMIGTLNYTWNGGATIDVTLTVIDYDNSTTSDGVTPAKTINYGAAMLLTARYPAGVAPSSRVTGASGSAITKTAPTFSAPQGTYWY